MKRFLQKKWLISIGVAALVLLIVGITVPILAASSSNDVNSYSNAYIDGPTMSRLADVLGMTPADLSSQLKAGKTLMAIGQEHNVTANALEDAIMAPYTDQLTLRVKYGYVTQEQMDTMMANARNQVSNLLQLDLSSANGQNSPAYGYGRGCYGYMQGYFNGYGPGVMGPGMMNGWYNNNGTATPASPNPNSNGNATPGAVYGGGMMGGYTGGMMGRR